MAQEYAQQQKMQAQSEKAADARQEKAQQSETDRQKAEYAHQDYLESEKVKDHIKGLDYIRNAQHFYNHTSDAQDVLAQAGIDPTQDDYRAKYATFKAKMTTPQLTGTSSMITPGATSQEIPVTPAQPSAAPIPTGATGGSESFAHMLGTGDSFPGQESGPPADLASRIAATTPGEPGQPIAQPAQVASPDYAPAKYNEDFFKEGTDLKDDAFNLKVMEAVQNGLDPDAARELIVSHNESLKSFNVGTPGALYTGKVKNVEAKTKFTLAHLPLLTQQIANAKKQGRNIDARTALAEWNLKKGHALLPLTEQMVKAMIDERRVNTEKAQAILPYVGEIAANELDIKQQTAKGAMSAVDKSKALADIDKIQMDALKNRPQFTAAEKAGGEEAQWDTDYRNLQTVGQQQKTHINALPTKGEGGGQAVGKRSGQSTAENPADQQRLQAVLSHAQRANPALYGAIIRARRKLTPSQIFAKYGSDPALKAIMAESGVK
jgi:hypothetical protein